MELIDKSAIIAEIEDKINKYTKRGEESDAKRDGYGMYWGGVISCLNEIRSLLDTLEVKEVNEELASEFDSCGLTWQDIKDIVEIGNDFMNSEESDDLNEEEYYTDILKRFLGKKGGEA